MEEMMKKSIKQMEKELDEELPDRDIDKEKLEMISQLKKLKKEEIISKPVKYTLWKRILKTMGL
jgi:hypothetical protein